MILFIYRVLGNQLVPLFPPNRLGLIHLLLNSALNLLTFFYLLERDVLQFDSLVSAILPVKPLFSLLVKFCIKYSVLSLIISTQIYCFYYGPEVVKALNSPLFNSVPFFQSKAASVKIVVIFTLINLATFFINFSHQLRSWLGSAGWPPSLESLFAVLVLFTVNANVYFYLHLCLYLQIGTSVLLARLEATLRLSRNIPRLSKSDTLSVFSQLRHLALTHERVVLLIAFPLGYLILVLCLGAINCAGMVAIFYNGNLTILIMLFYPITSGGYLTLLTYLNQGNLKAFDRLASELSKRKSAKNVLKNEDVTVKYTFEMKEQYRRCFQLRLFSMANLDSRFILAAFFLVLNFVVFLAQTK